MHKFLGQTSVINNLIKQKAAFSKRKLYISLIRSFQNITSKLLK